MPVGTVSVCAVQRGLRFNKNNNNNKSRLRSRNEREIISPRMRIGTPDIQRTTTLWPRSLLPPTYNVFVLGLEEWTDNGTWSESELSSLRCCWWRGRFLPRHLAGSFILLPFVQRVSSETRALSFCFCKMTIKISFAHFVVDKFNNRCPKVAPGAIILRTGRCDNDDNGWGRNASNLSGTRAIAGLSVISLGPRKFSCPFGRN